MDTMQPAQPKSRHQAVADISPEQSERIDHLAKAYGVKRADVVRKCLTLALPVIATGWPTDGE